MRFEHELLDVWLMNHHPTMHVAQYRCYLGYTRSTPSSLSLVSLRFVPSVTEQYCNVFAILTFVDSTLTHECFISCIEAVRTADWRIRNHVSVALCSAFQGRPPGIFAAALLRRTYLNQTKRNINVHACVCLELTCVKILLRAPHNRRLSDAQ